MKNILQKVLVHNPLKTVGDKVIHYVTLLLMLAGILFCLDIMKGGN